MHWMLRVKFNPASTPPPENSRQLPVHFAFSSLRSKRCAALRDAFAIDGCELPAGGTFVNKA
jgi:hypothetical protein